MTDVDAKLAELEARIAALESQPAAEDNARGVIRYGGSVDFNGPIDWTIQYGAGAVRQLPAHARVEVLAALGHPVRQALVEVLLDGSRTGVELAEAVGLSSAGQLHHHLRALTSARIVEQQSRGRYHIPPTKVVPVLVLMTAAADIAEVLR